MDWITLSVEIIGVVILCVWIVIPIREFEVIARRILPKKMEQKTVPLEQSTVESTLPVMEILP